MNRQGIIERVKIKLDELTPLDGGVDHPLDGHINPLIDEAVNEIILIAPIEKLFPISLKNTRTTVVESVNGVEGLPVIEDKEGIEGVVFGTNSVTDGDTVTTTTIEAVDRPLSVSESIGTIVISTLEAPRVIGLKVEDWKREVTVFEAIGSTKEVLQANKYSRGTINRPVVSVFNDGSNKVFTCYSTNTENPTVSLRAIKKQKAEELHEDLLTPLVLLTAAKVAQATEQLDLHKTLYQLYTNSLA